MDTIRPIQSEWVDGTVKPGIRRMGHALEIDRFMGDMERFGMKPSVTMEAQERFDE